MAQENQWKHFEAVSHYALDAAPRDYLDKIRENIWAVGVASAVARHDTPAIFNRLIDITQFQGISDLNAVAYARTHGLVTWDNVRPALDDAPTCPRLRSYWSYANCGFRKGAHTCVEPRFLGVCSVPTHPARKGALTVAAVSLALFMRDVCNDDLVSWLDQRLADADPGRNAPDRAVRMGTALLQPLREIYGIGDKVWSLALAGLLLGADPNRERWVTTGASMIVIDSLVHNHLHRTGVLRRFKAEHSYGPLCYAPGGCADLVRGLADRIDARQFSPEFPACFPRFVQHAIWRWCSASALNICNGNKIDDRETCGNEVCPTFQKCDRVALHI